MGKPRGAACWGCAYVGLGRQQSSPVTVVGRHFSSNSNTALSRVYCTCAQLVDAMAVFCFVFSPRMCSEMTGSPVDD